MKKHYLKLLLIPLIYFSLFINSKQLQAQTPGVMEFGAGTVVISNSANPSHDFGTNSNGLSAGNQALLNGFDLSSTTGGGAIFLAFALSGNGAGTDQIGGASDAVLGWIGNGSASVSSGTLSTDNGSEFSLTTMQFAYEQALGGATMNFTFTGKRDGTDVGTLVLTSPAHATAINLDFSSPTSGTFINIDELVIATASPLFGGFSIDAKTIATPITNVAPAIAIAATTLAYTEGDTATQIDATATVSDADGDADWNGGTLVAQITANAEAADEISIADTDADATTITVSGTNIFSNGTDIGDLSTSGGAVTNGTALTITFDADATNANVQEVLQSLRYRSTSTSPGTATRTITITATDTNAGTNNDARTVTVTSVPSITSVSVPFNGTYIASQNLDFTINFDENIIVNTTSGTPQLAIMIGATMRQAIYVGGTGSSTLAFRYTVQTGDSDADGIAVGTLAANNGSNGTLQNGSGTNANLTLNSVGATSSILVDAVAPLITSIVRQLPTTSPTNADALVFRITFGENVQSVGAADFTITGASGVSIGTTGSGSTYDVTFSGGDLASVNGTVILGFAGGQNIADTAGNALTNLTPTGTNNNTFVLDNTNPLISSIVRQTPTTSPTNADALAWDVTFDGAVTNVDATDFAVSGTTATVASVTNPSGNTYRVTISGGDLAGLNGTVTLGFAGGQNIADASGNTLTNLTPTGTNNNTFVVDNTNPLISSIARQSPTTSPTNADALAWDVTFDGTVINVDATDFTVSGTTATVASVTNPSGNVYRVTVSGGDLADLNATVTLGFAGGQNIADAVGNALTNLTPTGTNNNTFVIDNTNPLISSIVRQTPTTSPTNADALAWDVTFDGVVTNVDATDFTVSGTTATVASVTNPSGNVYRVTVSGGDLAGLNGTVTLGFAGGQNIADASGNTLTNLTPTGTNNNTFVIDNTPPVYTWTGVSNSTWGVSSNWNPTNVPPANADIIIPSGLVNYPTASAAVTFNTITIDSGASFIPQSTVTGVVTYKRSLPTTNWYLVAAPVSGETSENIISNHTFASGTGSNIGIGAYLNDIGATWAYSTLTTTGPVPSGGGLSMKLDAPGEISITGTANTSSVPYPITTGTRDNFNLIGNPFTSYVNSATFTTANTGLLSEETVWLWNGTSYVTYNALSSIELAPGQGFFVEAGSNGNITFATSNQSHQNDTFMRQAPKSTFELSIAEGANKASTKVFYVDNKTTGFDNGYDSKIFGGADYKFKVYTELVSDNEGKKLAIQALPNQNLETMIVPVGLIAEAGKKVTFSLKAQNLPNNSNVFLEDRVNNTLVNISKEDYVVTLKNTAKGTGQFYIHTSAKNIEDIDIKQDLQNVSIYKSADNNLTIAGLQTDKTSVNVYSILGKKVISIELKSTGSHIIQLPKTAVGVYIVELRSSLGKISKKIILE